jgi:hypothetical protein
MNQFVMRIFVFARLLREVLSRLSPRSVNKKCLSAVFCMLTMSGCATKPTVYVYGKYLEPPQVQQLTTQLSQNGLDVEVNDFDFPTTINSNTLLYSLLLQSPEAIDNTSAIAEREGFPINSVQLLAQGNHWYTKNSLALFLFPDGKKPKGTLLAQDLMHTYKAQSCGDGHRLSLNKDGTYQLTLKTEDSTAETKGHWKFRQFPYLELQELNSPYANYYFEISSEQTKDQVSELNLTHLQLLNANSANPLAQECVFTYGLRI